MEAGSCSVPDDLGQIYGGDWCEDGGSVIIGRDSVRCVYSLSFTSSGSITSGSLSSTGSSLDLGSYRCDQSDFPSYTINQSITYKGITYNIQGSCPGGKRYGYGNVTNCSVSVSNPSGAVVSQDYEAGNDFIVDWSVPGKFGKPARVEFLATTSPVVSCKSASSSVGHKISTFWSYVEG